MSSFIWMLCSAFCSLTSFRQDSSGSSKHRRVSWVQRISFLEPAEWSFWHIPAMWDRWCYRTFCLMKIIACEWDCRASVMACHFKMLFHKKPALFLGVGWGDLDMWCQNAWCHSAHSGRTFLQEALSPPVTPYDPCWFRKAVEKYIQRSTESVTEMKINETGDKWDLTS